MSTMFRKVSRFATGYNPGEVDEFFDAARSVYEGGGGTLATKDVRTVAFDLVRQGYAVDAVDAALDRLESAFTARERSEFVAQYGQDAWMERMAELARTMYGRLTRPDGQRFAPPQRGRPGYDKDEVDALCGRLVAYFDRGKPLTSAEVRAATFRRRKGSRAYAEGSVDAFLSRAVEVLSGVE